jgi:hypothetical protein
MEIIAQDKRLLFQAYGAVLEAGTQGQESVVETGSYSPVRADRESGILKPLGPARRRQQGRIEADVCIYIRRQEEKGKDNSELGTWDR